MVNKNLEKTILKTLLVGWGYFSDLLDATGYEGEYLKKVLLAMKKSGLIKNEEKEGYYSSVWVITENGKEFINNDLTETEKKISTYGLTSDAFNILRDLQKNDGSNLEHVAKVISSSNIHASAIIFRLELLNLVQRKGIVRSRVFLTDKGRSLLEQIKKIS
ncbi:MAG: hypothetical protein ACOX15_02975 [Tepidanaerobacteraceae bacterium]